MLGVHVNFGRRQPEGFLRNCLLISYSFCLKQNIKSNSILPPQPKASFKIEMESRLFEAARTGNVSALHQLLLENPLILADCAVISPHENPLHIATKAGQLAFVQEIIRKKAGLVTELNVDGFRPLDIASAIGHLEIAKAIIATDPQVCRLKGRDGRTALHYAAINERIEIIDELLTACGESINDVTSLGETALHLALKYYKFEAFTNLVKWLEKLDREELVNLGDKDGNTILHLAVSRKQHESIELLLTHGKILGILELDAKTSRGFTAMDMLDMMMENPNDTRLKEILQRAGAIGTQTPPHAVNSNQINNPEAPTGFSKDWIKYFQFQFQRDSPGDTRNALLVVAALIATVTFQAGMNPPKSFVPDENHPKSTPYAEPPTVHHHPVATYGLLSIGALLGSSSLSHWFVLGNSLGLAASLSIIIYLTNGFPFRRELQIAIYSMMFAYGCGISDIKPKNAGKYISLGVAFLLPFLLRWPTRWVRKCWKLRKHNSSSPNGIEA